MSHPAYLWKPDEVSDKTSERVPSSFLELSWLDRHARATQVVGADQCLERARGFAVFALVIVLTVRDRSGGIAVQWTWHAGWLLGRSPLGQPFWYCPFCDEKANYGLPDPPVETCECEK
jgi:hypothetical protein